MLDRRVVEFAFRLPTHRTMPASKASICSAHWLESACPIRCGGCRSEALLRQSGHGWLARSPARSKDEVLRTNSFVNTVCDPEIVRRLFDENRQRVANHGYALWHCGCSSAGAGRFTTTSGDGVHLEELAIPATGH
jgi:hypothetical protein